MRNITKVLSSLAISGILCSTALIGSVSAGVMQDSAPDASKLPAGTLIYSEDFEGISASDTDKALKLLGWSKAEDLRKFTMKLSIADGKLYVDNLDESSEDSYALIMDSDFLKKVCNADYTYEYDVTYRDAGNTSRYVSLLCNYDGKDNYNTVDMRIRGDGYNQVRRGDSWIHYNDTVCPLRATDDTAIVTQLFGDKFDENGMLLKDRTVTIRVETSIENGPTVYVNGIKASDMQANKDQWNTIDSYAICFKASKLIKAEIDNIRIWTGMSDKPIETTNDITDSDASASTFDISFAAMAAAFASSCVVVTIARKKRV